VVAAVDRWRTWRVLALIALVVVAVGTESMWLPLVSLDEQSNVVYGDQVLVGRVPHRDFFATYGPANYWLIAGAFHLFGASVESQRGVGLVYHFAVCAGVFVCCTTRGKGIALAAAVTAALFMIPLGSIAYAWFAALALVLFSVALLRRAPPGAAYGVAGALGASCAWWRPEMVGVAAMSAIPFLVPMGRRRLSYLVGFGAAIAAMVAYSFAVGPEWVTNVLTRVGVDAGYANVDPYVIFGGAVVVGLGVAMAVCGFRRRERICFSIAILITASLPQLLQRPDLAHLLFIACATVPLSMAHTLAAGDAGPEAAETSRLLRLELGTWLASALAVTLVVGVLGVLGRVRNDVVHVREGDRSLIADAASARRIRATVDELTSASSGTPVFIGAQNMSQPTLTWAMLYHLLPPSSVQAYYLEIPPGLNDAQAGRLGKDIRTSQVLLLTPFSDGDRRLLFPKIGPIADDADAAVRETFCPTAETPYGGVFERCAASE
jgi:hypothetical protein